MLTAFLKLMEKTELTRRGFLVTSIASGFALAVQPIAAQTKITTDANGLTVGEVKIPVKGGEMPAYSAMPEKGKNFPLVLVVQEIFGVHEHIQDLCRRFAKLGFMAIAPSLYFRYGDTTKIEKINDIFPIVQKVPDSEVMEDLDATVEYAKSTKKSNTKKLSITGFCWGGRIVWLYSVHNPKVKAGAAWYGRLVAPPNAPVSPLQPKQPIDFVPMLKVPVLGLYGGADSGIPNNTVEMMQAKLKEYKTKSEIILYPDTPHGFNADYRTSYRKDKAEDAWKRMLDWFKKNGAM